MTNGLRNLQYVEMRLPLALNEFKLKTGLYTEKHVYINAHKNIANKYCRISDCLSVILQKNKTVAKNFFLLIISSSLQITNDSSIKYAVSILQLELIFSCSCEWFPWVHSVGYCMLSITCFSTMNAICCTSSER